MSTELHWPRESQFRDPARDFRFTGPGTTEVPDDAVEAYRERGWQDPPQETEAPEPTTQAEPEEPDGEPEPEEPDESEADADGDESEESVSSDFDPEAFVDDSWQSVTSRIEDGEADGHLDAVMEAEQNRKGGPRDSVKGSIEERQG